MDWTHKVVKVKPEWLNPGEDPDTLYFVIEDRDDRVLVGLLDGLLEPDPDDLFPVSGIGQKTGVI